MPLGTHAGTDKTTKGIPDTIVRCENGQFRIPPAKALIKRKNHSFQSGFFRLSKRNARNDGNFCYHLQSGPTTFFL